MVNPQFNQAGFERAMNAAAGAAGSAPPGVDPTWWQQTMNRVNNARTNTGNFVRDFTNANNTLMSGSVTAGGRLGSRVATGAEQFARGMTGRTALGIGSVGAGLATALAGGGFGETVGAGGGAAVGTALAGKLIPVLAKGGPFGALAAGATALALPMLTSSVAGGVGRALDKGPFATVGSAMQQGSQTRINNELNPSGSLGPTLTEAEQRMLRNGQLNADLIKKMGYDAQDVSAYGVQKVAIPLMNHQALLRAKMLPLDTAARLAQQSNQNIGQMFNTSIAGTSGIAQQIAANNPYGQVMI